MILSFVYEMERSLYVHDIFPTNINILYMLQITYNTGVLTGEASQIALVASKPGFFG